VDRQLTLQFHVSRSRSLLLQPSVEIEDIVDQIDQVVDAVVVDSILDRREQAELATETKDIPGIGQRATFNGPMQ
jgi:hypothetical protein